MDKYKWTNINGQILDLQLYNYIFLRFHENNNFGEILKKYYYISNHTIVKVPFLKENYRRLLIKKHLFNIK